MKGFSIESFFLFPSFLVAEKQKILRVEPRGGEKKGEIEKKQKKNLLTHSHHFTNNSLALARKHRPSLLRKSC